MPKRRGGAGAGEKEVKRAKQSARGGASEGEVSGGSVRIRVGDDTGIVLATFPGGPPAPGTLLGRRGGPAERASWKLLGNKRDRHETLIGETTRMAWRVGCAEGVAARGLEAGDRARDAATAATENESGLSLSNASPATSCYMVGVFNRKTNKLRLHYAGDRAHALEQSVKRLSSVKAKKNAFEGLSYRDQREELTLGFGSKGSQAGLRRMKKNVLTEDNIGSSSYLKAQISSSHASTSASSSSSSSGVAAASRNSRAEDAHRRSMLPPFNTDAETPEEAYPFDEFLPNDDNMLLDKHAKKVDKGLFSTAAGDDDNEKKRDLWEPRSFFVRKRLEELKDNFSAGSSGKTRRRKAIKRLLFLEYLLVFARYRGSIKPIPDLRSVAEDRGIPLPIFQRLLGKFSDKVAFSGKPPEDGSAAPAHMYRKSERHQKSLLLWILVTCLHVMSFNIKRLQYLAKELRMSPKEMVPLCKYLGATYKTAGKRDGQTDYHIMLSTPLTFPAPSKGPRGGRW